MQAFLRTDDVSCSWIQPVQHQSTSPIALVLIAARFDRRWSFWWDLICSPELSDNHFLSSIRHRIEHSSVIFRTSSWHMELFQSFGSIYLFLANTILAFDWGDLVPLIFRPAENGWTSPRPPDSSMIVASGFRNMPAAELRIELAIHDPIIADGFWSDWGSCQKKSSSIDAWSMHSCYRSTNELATLPLPSSRKSIHPVRSNKFRSEN